MLLLLLQPAEIDAARYGTRVNALKNLCLAFHDICQCRQTMAERGRVCCRKKTAASCNVGVEISTFLRFPAKLKSSHLKQCCRLNFWIVLIALLVVKWFLGKRQTAKQKGKVKKHSNRLNAICKGRGEKNRPTKLWNWICSVQSSK